MMDFSINLPLIFNNLPLSENKAALFSNNLPLSSDKRSLMYNKNSIHTTSPCKICCKAF